METFEKKECDLISYLKDTFNKNNTIRDRLEFTIPIGYELDLLRQADNLKLNPHMKVGFYNSFVLNIDTPKELIKLTND